MATQLQKYNGNNRNNNRVLVDYENKKVIFEKAKHQGISVDLASVILSYSARCIAYTSLIICFISLCYAIDGLISAEQFILNFIGSVFIGISIALIIIFVMITRGKEIPEMFSKIFKRKEIIILPENVSEDMWVLGEFQNIALEYELNGDFTNIKQIDIRNRRYDNEFKYYCIFKFKSPIKNGFMKIRFT
jgi:hypothetical protein